jgi:prolyl 4-hydroxylase
MGATSFMPNICEIENMNRNIEPLWLEWIRLNLMRLCEPLEMVKMMLESGQWSYQDAAEIVDSQLVDLNMDINWRLKQPYINSQNKISIDDRDISVSVRISSPEVALLENVLSDEECDLLIEMALNKGLSRSLVLGGLDGNSIEHDGRTSTSIFFQRSENPLISSIERRLSHLTNWPTSKGEGLQVVCYAKGQQYAPHFDWFNPDSPSATKTLARGGQRLSTTVIYLKCPNLGGSTAFSSKGIEFIPTKGGAIFFKNVSRAGTLDQDSRHSGDPVREGLKIVATYWQRECEFI